MAGDFQGWQKFGCTAVWMLDSGEHQLWRPVPALKTVSDLIPVKSSVIQRFLLGDGVYKRAP